jgi:magnesium transporter
MLKAYQPRNGGVEGAIIAAGLAIPPNALWLDLLDPSEEERSAVGRALGTSLPTHADMEEIEVSSRLFRRGDLMFMTALLIANSETERPVADAITFVLGRERLVTVRYVQPLAFRKFEARVQRDAAGMHSANLQLLGLIDTIIERIADILERAGRDVEAISRRIFDPGPSGRLDTGAYRDVLGELGRRNDLTSMLRESLLSLTRLLNFWTQATDEIAEKEVRTRTRALVRDVQSLQDHSSFLAGKLNYLLEATLGLINIDQNNIIKVLSAAATVFLPPTVIGTIINFKYFPALPWPWGFPVSLLVMLFSAIVPYLLLRRRGWL